jgi:hypothetical protein
MATCVEVDGAGFVVVVDPQPATFEACTLVLVSGSEHAASPLVLTVEEGGLIGGAIMLLWGAAFGLRMLRRALDVG